VTVGDDGRLSPGEAPVPSEGDLSR